jgi:hypothetical protein
VDLPTRALRHIRFAHRPSPRLARAPGHLGKLGRTLTVIALTLAGTSSSLLATEAASQSLQKPQTSGLVAKNLKLPLVVKAGAPAVANVTVERIAKDSQRKSLSEIVRLDWSTSFIAEGVTVRFERLDLQPLLGLVEKLRTLANVKRLEIRNLALYAPGDSVPRLIANEVEARTDGGWALKGVLLAGRPSMNNCVLSIDETGELRLTAGMKKPLLLQSLMSEVDNPAFTNHPPDLPPPPTVATPALAAKSPASAEPSAQTKR